MRILQVHNFYQQAGGEDTVVRNEGALLRDHGHEVVEYFRRNDEVGGLSRVLAARDALWSSRSFKEVYQLIAETQPDVMHVHNTFPLVSPSVYYAAATMGVPVVQTLHNFRLACPNALMYRSGGPCDKCVGRKMKWSAVRYRCYRGSAAASFTVAASLAVHAAMGTWRDKVSCYIALTEFARAVMLREGLPEQRVRVKPNFVYRDVGTGAGRGGFALFVGRITEEKGVRVALEAWRRNRSLPELRFIGDGPLAGEVRAAAALDRRVAFLGSKTHDETIELMGQASVLVFPSTWYEGMPMTIVEALSRGTPVAASRLGGAAEMLANAKYTRLFRPGDADDLAQSALALLSPSVQQLARSEARMIFESRYSAAENYRQLASIYSAVVAVGRG